MNSVREFDKNWMPFRTDYMLGVLNRISTSTSVRRNNAKSNIQLPGTQKKFRLFVAQCYYGV
jgi:hypothetical protein